MTLRQVIQSLQLPQNEIQIREPLVGMKRLRRVTNGPDGLTTSKARLLRVPLMAMGVALQKFGGDRNCMNIPMKILALSLLREIASVEKVGENEGGDSIDLHAEVRRFEEELIRSALIQTGGRQRPAARLLRTKTTTLNTKIKRYKIDVNKPRIFTDERG